MVKRSESSGALPLAPSPHSNSQNKLRLSIKLSKPIYVAGERITGVLVVDVRDKHLKVGEVGVDFGAREELKSLAHTSTKSLLSNQPHIVFHTPTQGSALSEVRSKDDGMFVPARCGVTKFEFSFKCKSSFPSTCALGDAARVQYELRAYASYEADLDRTQAKATATVKVVERLQNWQHANFREEVRRTAISEKLGNSNARGDGKVEMIAKLEKEQGGTGGSLFWPRDHAMGLPGHGVIQLELKVRNGTKKTVAGVKLSLIRRLEVLGPKSMDRPSPVITHVEHVESFTGFEYDFPSGNNDWVTVRPKMELPTDAETWVVQGGQLFMIRTVLKVEVDCGVFKKNLSVELPIHVYQSFSLPTEAHQYFAPPEQMQEENRAGFGRPQGSVGMNGPYGYQYGQQEGVMGSLYAPPNPTGSRAVSPALSAVSGASSGLSYIPPPPQPPFQYANGTIPSSMSFSTYPVHQLPYQPSVSPVPPPPQPPHMLPTSMSMHGYPASMSYPALPIGTMPMPNHPYYPVSSTPAPYGYPQPQPPPVQYVAFDPNAPAITPSGLLGGPFVPPPPRPPTSAVGYAPQIPGLPSPAGGLIEPSRYSGSSASGGGSTPESSVRTPLTPEFVSDNEDDEERIRRNLTAKEPYVASKRTQAHLQQQKQQQGRRTSLSPPPSATKPSSQQMRTPPPASPSSRFTSPSLLSPGPGDRSRDTTLDTIGEDGESQAGTMKSHSKPSPSGSSISNHTVHSVQGVLAHSPGRGSAQHLEDLVDEHDRRMEQKEKERTLPTPPIPSWSTKPGHGRVKAQDIFEAPDASPSPSERTGRFEDAPPSKLEPIKLSESPVPVDRRMVASPAESSTSSSARLALSGLEALLARPTSAAAESSLAASVVSLTRSLSRAAVSEKEDKAPATALSVGAPAGGLRAQRTIHRSRTMQALESEAREPPRERTISNPTPSKPEPLVAERRPLPQPPTQREEFVLQNVAKATPVQESPVQQQQRRELPVPAAVFEDKKPSPRVEEHYKLREEALDRTAAWVQSSPVAPRALPTSTGPPVPRSPVSPIVTRPASPSKVVPLDPSPGGWGAMLAKKSSTSSTRRPISMPARPKDLPFSPPLQQIAEPVEEVQREPARQQEVRQEPARREEARPARLERWKEEDERQRPVDDDEQPRRYDVKSARGGRGGRVTEVAQKLREVAQEEERRVSPVTGKARPTSLQVHPGRPLAAVSNTSRPDLRTLHNMMREDESPPRQVVKVKRLSDPFLAGGPANAYLNTTIGRPVLASPSLAESRSPVLPRPAGAGVSEGKQVAPRLQAIISAYNKDLKRF